MLLSSAELTTRRSRSLTYFCSQYASWQTMMLGSHVALGRLSPQHNGVAASVEPDNVRVHDGHASVHVRAVGQ